MPRSSSMATETVAVAKDDSQEIKLFNKWSCDVNIDDISLQDYIAIKDSRAVYVPHTAGRYAVRRFRKAQARTLRVPPLRRPSAVPHC